MKREVVTVKIPMRYPISADAAHGFQRYSFGREFVLESESWREAEEKIDRFLQRRKESSPGDISYYSDGGLVLWREYQLLFMCQFLEFRVAELIGHLHRLGYLKDEYVSTLSCSSKANAERVKDLHRLTSPASLLVDFGFNLGSLLNILENHTLPFGRKDELVTALQTFNSGRVAFIHHSFNSEKKSGTTTTRQLVAETLQRGKLVLRLVADITSAIPSRRSKRKPLTTTRLIDTTT
jgi:hypothetical protein